MLSNFFSFKIILVTILCCFSSCTWRASITDIDREASVNNVDNSFVGECVDEALNTSQCLTATQRYVTSVLGSNIVGPNASLSSSITAGYYSGTTTATMSDANLLATNIKNGTSIFGVVGSFSGSFQTVMASTAHRDAGVQVIANLAGQSTSSQITLESEQNTYAGIDLPNTGGFNYRDIPDVSKDDDGYMGTSCKYALRPANDCGTNQNTIAARMADCLLQNPLSSSWNGEVQCNGSKGLWSLVTRNGANKEVWQDRRTGKIWSSKVTNGFVNWCQASGNTQMAAVTYSNSYNNTAGTPIVGNGTIGSLSGGDFAAAETIVITFSNATTFSVSGANCGGGGSSGGLTTTAGSTVTFSRANYCSFTLTQGSTNFAVNDKFVLQSVDGLSYGCVPGAISSLQPATPISYCTEAAGFSGPAGENWTTGVYLPTKGGMGKIATAQSPSVRWRLPSVDDFKIADVNGIRLVMPDMGIAGINRPTADGSPGAGTIEWTSSVFSFGRSNAFNFLPNYGHTSNAVMFSGLQVRCVGR